MSKTTRRLSDAAGKGAIAARKAKRGPLDTFGLPETFVVKAGGQSFTRELRRFGDVLLERGIEAFDSLGSQALARADGGRRWHPCPRRRICRRSSGHRRDRAWATAHAYFRSVLISGDRIAATSMRNRIAPAWSVTSMRHAPPGLRLPPL